MAVGWGFMAVSAALAVVAIVEALGATRVGLQPAGPSGYILPVSASFPGQLMHAVILAVLSGVAFFSGIGCFFWGVLRDARAQLDEITAWLRREGITGPRG